MRRPSVDHISGRGVVVCLDTDPQKIDTPCQEADPLGGRPSARSAEPHGHVTSDAGREEAYSLPLWTESQPRVKTLPSPYFVCGL